MQITHKKWRKKIKKIEKHREPYYSFMLCLKIIRCGVMITVAFEFRIMNIQVAMASTF